MGQGATPSLLQAGPTRLKPPRARRARRRPRRRRRRLRRLSSARSRASRGLSACLMEAVPIATARRRSRGGGVLPLVLPRQNLGGLLELERRWLLPPRVVQLKVVL